jgi:glycine oxidase
MLSPLAELAVADEVVFEQAQRAMALWPQWLQQLREDSGREVYYRRDGTLVVAHAPDRATLEHFTRVLHHKLPAAHRAALQAIDGERLAQLEPALAGRFDGGLYLDGEGQLANDELMAALAVAIDKLGGRWHECHPVDSLHAGDAALVIDARGIGAKAAWPGLRGVRGEVITVECLGVQLQRPVRLMHPRYQLYIAPRPAQRFVVGATELESEDDGPMTLRSTLELGSALYSLHPAFGEARVLRLAVGLRPTLDDHRPALRRHEGVWQINGLYRHGFLCAPALVDELMHEVS